MKPRYWKLSHDMIFDPETGLLYLYTEKDGHLGESLIVSAPGGDSETSPIFYKRVAVSMWKRLLSDSEEL